MEPQTLKAEVRNTRGTREARRMRQDGRLPGIIYGHAKDPQMFTIDRHDLELELLHRHRLLALDLGSGSESYFIREVQYDHLGTAPVHLDLMRVDLDEIMKLQVAVELVGVPHNGMIEHGVDRVEVECRVAQIPECLKAVVSDLDIGDTLTAADLEMPPGVKLVGDGHDMVVTVRALSAAAAVETEEEEQAVSTEPEIISKGKADIAESAD